MLVAAMASICCRVGRGVFAFFFPGLPPALAALAVPLTAGPPPPPPTVARALPPACFGAGFAERVLLVLTVLGEVALGDFLSGLVGPGERRPCARSVPIGCSSFTCSFEVPAPAPPGGRLAACLLGGDSLLSSPMGAGPASALARSSSARPRGMGKPPETRAENEASTLCRWGGLRAPSLQRCLRRRTLLDVYVSEEKTPTVRRDTAN